MKLLKDYRKKRNFVVSPEPSGQGGHEKKKGAALIYVIQKHRASHLHYDFRLESGGTREARRPGQEAARAGQPLDQRPRGT